MTTQKNIHAKEAAATSKFVVARKKPDQLVSDTQHIVALIKSNALYSDPNLKQAVTQWQVAADTIDQSDQAIKTARLTLAGLLAQRAKNITAWKRSTKAILAAVDTVSVGSAQVITQLGFSLNTRQALPPSSDPPQGLHVRYTKSMALVVKWKAVKPNHGYVLEIGDAAGQTFGPPITCLKATYEPQGLSPGQKVTLRVAVQRKEGLSGWSDVVAVTVR